MDAGTLLFILIVLCFLYFAVSMDSRKKKQEKPKTWTQRGREKHRESKRR